MDKYNDKRKNILQLLDSGNDVSILELGMYDLTPYFDVNKDDPSLYETIMLNKNYERRIMHIEQKDLFFSPPQYDALTCLDNHNRMILSAPTSFGKTLIVKEYIYIKQPKHIVYIVPTNALAYELEKSFKGNKKFDNYLIFDTSSSIMGSNEAGFEQDYLFFIGTQEKFLEIDSNFLKNIDLFVIDEAYKLQESVSNQRAYKLSQTFLDSISNKAKQIVLLTPKAIFKGFEKYNFFKFESDFNSVEKSYIVLEKEKFYDELIDKSKNEKSILFCTSPGQINDAYASLKTKINSNTITPFSKQLESEIHPDWCVVKLLKAGILTHHGQMPKYVQNKMINLFNESKDYNLLLGTNSISEGINTSTKNLFIHPDYSNFQNTLLLKNTIGRAGRLGQYPIGYIFSTTNICNDIEKDIEISLAISDEEELSEIEDSKNEEIIQKCCDEYNIEPVFCKDLMSSYKYSISKMRKIFDALRKDQNFPGISNLPFIAHDAFKKEYTGIPNIDAVLIKGYLQMFYIYGESKEKVFLNNFNDRILYFKRHYKQGQNDNTLIINYYLQFIYSTLEYYIMPIVNIGLEIKEKNNNWSFGTNVIKSLEDCRKRYYQKTYGDLNVDDLSDTQRNIITTLKDYGMMSSLKHINTDILQEIESQLKVRYSTIDVLNAIKKLQTKSIFYSDFFNELVVKYM